MCRFCSSAAMLAGQRACCQCAEQGLYVAISLWPSWFIEMSRDKKDRTFGAVVQNYPAMQAPSRVVTHAATGRSSFLNPDVSSVLNPELQVPSPISLGSIDIS
ncbi:hypothetical protein PVAP13_6NG136100 [Panicum virgatum]|uniref:Uncharacterized protein n=1 Tax=Panicum virgatum TaxID=38727 RepID=A0A8T0R0S8_PANVG|nr:hypothetical protein PVAP13_6NG136100 [Panicum virgatum]